jgi:PAS domain S-box-containing protein
LKEDLNTLLHNYNESSSEEYIKPYQFKLYGKDNKIIWVEISSTEILWYGEKSVLCFLTDVTGRRDYEIALYESEKRKSLLINSMKDLVFVVDSNLRIKELYNYKELIDIKEIINKKIDEIDFPIVNINMIKKAFFKIKETKQAKQIEYYITKDTRTQWFQAVISLIEDPLNLDTEFLFVVRNITKLKKAEKRIRELSYIDPVFLGGHGLSFLTDFQLLFFYPNRFLEPIYLH